MKKIHIIVQQSAVTDALEHLAKLGVVHIEHQQELKSFELSEMIKSAERLQTTIEILSGVSPAKDQASLNSWEDMVDELLKTKSAIQTLEDDIAKREELLKTWEPWGNFNLSDLHSLNNKGIHIELFRKKVSDKTGIPPKAIFKKIFTQNGYDHFVIISRQPIDLPFEKIKFPVMGLHGLQEIHDQEIAQLKKHKESIEEKAKYLNSLKTTLLAMQHKVQIEEASVGMAKNEQLHVLKGFAPVDACSNIEKESKLKHWGILIEDPDEDDSIPTLIKTPKWVNLIKPVFNLIEVLPGYKELDVSAVFLIFFTLFFGLLIGDAAYGFIFLVGTFIAQVKLKDKVKDKTPFLLMYLLTGVTIIWGVLTGTYFGQAWLQPTGISPIVPWLNNENNLQWVCLTIALVHLSIARIWNIVLKFPGITFLADVGWLMIVWGMYYLALYFVLGSPTPFYEKYLFMIGIPLAFFFMVPLKQFFKVAPVESIPFALGVIGAGTDIISYIRLFAVGVATVAVADAANGMWHTSLPGGMNYILFFFLHFLNMILAIMAILVHAVRLNVLEFSGHLGLQWSGHKYSPFKTIKQS